MGGRHRAREAGQGVASLGEELTSKRPSVPLGLGVAKVLRDSRAVGRSEQPSDLEARR